MNDIILALAAHTSETSLIVQAIIGALLWYRMGQVERRVRDLSHTRHTEHDALEQRVRALEIAVGGRA